MRHHGNPPPPKTAILFSINSIFFNHCIDIIHANSTQPSFILQVGLWLWLLRYLVWRGTAFGKPLSQYVSPEYCRNPCVITHVVYEQLVGIGQRQYNVHSNEHIVYKGTDVKKALKQNLTIKMSHDLLNLSWNH